ncbi:hypothetical protein [Burkholderia gladioli]|uniref:hypothetical protein n=1 Tax=Burkholderia gladioli TaxID=28095 RepID=UPI002FE07BC3
MRKILSIQVSRETGVGISGLILGISIACIISKFPGGSSDWASWVQAVGSIAAIIGALWVANNQSRRDIENRAAEKKKFDYLTSAELSWLSGDVVGFLNQFINIDSKGKFFYMVEDDQVADLLGRINWCRQRASNKGQLAMIGQLRKSLMRTVGIIRARMMDKSHEFSGDEVDFIDELRKEAVKVYNVMCNVEVDERYLP